MSSPPWGYWGRGRYHFQLAEPGAGLGLGHAGRSFWGDGRSPDGGKFCQLLQFRSISGAGFWAVRELSPDSGGGDPALSGELPVPADRLQQYRPARGIGGSERPAGRLGGGQWQRRAERLHQRLVEPGGGSFHGVLSRALAGSGGGRELLRPDRLPAAVRRGDLRSGDDDRRGGEPGDQHAGNPAGTAPSLCGMGTFWPHPAGFLLRCEHLPGQSGPGGLHLPQPAAPDHGLVQLLLHGANQSGAELSAKCRRHYDAFVLRSRRAEHQLVEAGGGGEAGGVGGDGRGRVPVQHHGKRRFRPVRLYFHQV